MRKKAKVYEIKDEKLWYKGLLVVSKAEVEGESKSFLRSSIVFV